MKESLEEYFGCEVKISKYRGKLHLPLFMTMRNIQIIETFGVKYALIDIKKETAISVAAMKKQQKQYEEALQCPVAYEMTISSMAMRNALIKNGISFIDIPGNLFLPFLGIVLQDNYKKQRMRTDKMMPATQMVFLELMYMEDNKSALKSEIAGKLGLTKTSVTRATVQLEEMGLIQQSKSGTEISVKRNLTRKQYYEKASMFLINPVQKVVTVKRDKSIQNITYAGETALSRMSMLNPPGIEEAAAYKADMKINEFEMLDERLSDPTKLVRIQLWKYNPLLFASNGLVDKVSLACSFIGNEDERIESCMEEMLEEL